MDLIVYLMTDRKGIKMNVFKKLLSFSWVMLFVLSPSISEAVTVCGNIRYWDGRTERNPSSTSNGILTIATAETNRAMPNAVIDAFDRDGNCVDFDSTCSEGDDDYLGSAYTDGNGGYCIDVDNVLNDVYLVSIFDHRMGSIRGAGSTSTVIRSSVSVDVNSNYIQNWNLTCPDDTYNTTSGYCDNRSDVDNYFAAIEPYANLLANMNDLYERMPTPSLYYEFNGHTNRIQVELTSACGGAGQTSDVDNICIKPGWDDNNQVLAHEMGHLVHRRVMDYPDTSSLSDGSCGSGTGTWGLAAGEKCAISEGWANFFAAAIYFYQNGSDAYYRSTSNNFEGDTMQFTSGLTMNCVAGNSGLRKRYLGNGGRYFWDLYDSTNGETRTYPAGPGSDNATMYLWEIIDIWSNFPDGTSNGQTRESGYDGRNAWDYESYDGSVHSELELNCLDSQVPH